MRGGRANLLEEETNERKKGTDHVSFLPLQEARGKEKEGERNNNNNVGILKLIYLSSLLSTRKGKEGGEERSRLHEKLEGGDPKGERRRHPLLYSSSSPTWGKKERGVRFK